jgi:glycosyltransferase involved in cell wall biosynthesis
MSNSPLVSGIINFFTTEKFFEEAIESVFAQAYENWELFLLNVSSTDGSAAIARCYAEQHSEKVCYLEHDNHQNLGMSATHKQGIHNARGKYLAFLVGDGMKKLAKKSVAIGAHSHTYTRLSHKYGQYLMLGITFTDISARRRQNNG